MDDQGVAQKVQGLSDVELALLLSLVAKENCIIQTGEESLEALDKEINLIARNVFGLSFASIQCSPSTTLEDFTHGILIDVPIKRNSTTPSTPNTNYRASAFKFERSYSGDLYQIANIVVVKCINDSAHQIQMQALELIRTRRIFTHTGVYSVPKPFLMVVVTAASSLPLSKHLNDHLFLSHLHTLEEGFPNTEESSEWIEDDKVSTSSIRRVASFTVPALAPVFSAEELAKLAALKDEVVLSVEVKRYLHDVLTFLRFHRAVESGVSPRATRHFELLVKCLAPLHGLPFATPSLVTLAARKVYMHRLTLVDAENERSMQYGSDGVTMAELLVDMTPELVIEDVISNVEVPV
jgi:MoxR-like ATPase